MRINIAKLKKLIDQNQSYFINEDFDGFFAAIPYGARAEMDWLFRNSLDVDILDPESLEYPISRVIPGVFGEGSDRENITILPFIKGEMSAKAFAGNEALKTLIIKNKEMTTVPIEMCRDCENLETVILPASVTSVQRGAFLGCTSLQNVYFPTETKLEFEDNVFPPRSNVNIHITNAIANSDNLLKFAAASEDTIKFYEEHLITE